MVTRLAPVVLGLAALLALAPAPASPPVSAREIVELTDLSSLAIGPSDQWLVYRSETASVDRNRYDLAWEIVPLDGSALPRRLADAGEGTWQDGVLVPEPPSWSPDGRWIYYRAVRDAQVQIWRAAIDGSRAEPITQDAANIVQFRVDRRSGAITYQVGPDRAAVSRAEQQEYDAGILIDASVDPSRGLFRSDRIDGRSATTRLNGAWFHHGGLLDDTPPRFRTLDPATRQLRPATEDEARGLKPGPKFFERIDGRLYTAAQSGDARGTAYVVETETPDVEQLAVTDRPTLAGAFVCRAAACTGHHIVNVAWAREGRRIIFVTLDADLRRSLHVWNLDTDAVTGLATIDGTLDGGRTFQAGCAVGEKHAVCVAASANMPPRLLAYPLSGETPHLLANPDAGLVRADQPQFAPIHWIDRQGRANSGYLLRPRGRAGPVPLFITYYHCAGYIRGGTGDEYPLRQLAQHGIAALCIDIPPASARADQIGSYRIAQAGVESAIRTLAAAGIVDPRHVGMGGLSFGGEVTLWIAMHSKMLSAIAVSNILITPTYYWFNAMRGRDTPATLLKAWGLGPPDKASRRWRGISAFYDPEAVRAPLLLQLPEHEMRATFPLVARISRTNTPVELWAYPDENHQKSQPRHKLAVYERNLVWFRYWLADEVDPCSADVARWATSYPARQKRLSTCAVARGR